MPQLRSQLNPRSADFQANAAAMHVLVDDLKAVTRQTTVRGLTGNGF
jgi:3-methylcrotonyl-CoA carboxylase beta subunit